MYAIRSYYAERRADRSLAIDANAIRNRELVAILNRATALDPSQRYVSVEALSKDVLAWLEHRPVEAFGGGGGYVFSRFVRRFPVASTLFAAFMLTLAAGLVISLALMQKAESRITSYNVCYTKLLRIPTSGKRK